MVWYVQPMQLKGEDDLPSGRWRLVAHSDEGGGFHPCSVETFGSAEEAYGDRASQEEAKRITGFPTPWEIEELKRKNDPGSYKTVCVAANKLLSGLYEFTHPGLSSEDLANAISEDAQRLEMALDAVKELWKED